MYSRNTAARRREQENCENCNHYRYSIPPRYDGSRFRHREKGEVIALPDSAFSGVAEDRETSAPETEIVEKAEPTPKGVDLANVLNEGASTQEQNRTVSAEVSSKEQLPVRLLEHMKSDDLMLIVIVFVLFLESGGENFDGELLFLLALLLGMGSS